MYRCFACDAPALMNCECHTQVELPGDAPTEEERVSRICIASGEDAVILEETSVDA